MTLNASGVRSGGRKGVFGGLTTHVPGVICTRGTNAKGDQSLDRDS